MAGDDFRLPPDHPILVEARERRARQEAELRDLKARLTSYSGEKVQLVMGVALSLFVRDDPAGRLKGAGGYPDPTGDDLLVLLGYMREVRSGLDDDERRLMEGARRRGKTWQEIAENLGLKSRQAARQRFMRLGGKPTELDEQIKAKEEAPHED